MRLTGSRTYYRPTPPKMLPGLVEIMEGLTKEVLENNPTEIYGFCASHMEKLLEKRDGPFCKKSLSLEEKIARAQEKVRQRSEKRIEEFGKHFFPEAQSINLVNKETDDNLILPVPQLKSTPVSDYVSSDSFKDDVCNQKQITTNIRTPVHHELALGKLIQVEIAQELISDNIAPEGDHDFVSIKLTKTSSKEDSTETSNDMNENKAIPKAQPVDSVSTMETTEVQVDPLNSKESIDSEAVCNFSMLHNVQHNERDLPTNADKIINQKQNPKILQQEVEYDNEEVNMKPIGNEVKDPVIVSEKSESQKRYVENTDTSNYNSESIQIEHEEPLIHDVDNTHIHEISLIELNTDNVHVAPNFKKADEDVPQIISNNSEVSHNSHLQLLSRNEKLELNSHLGANTDSVKDTHTNQLLGNLETDSVNNSDILQQKDFPVNESESSTGSVQTKQVENIQIFEVAPAIDISNTIVENEMIKDLHLCDDITNCNVMKLNTPLNTKDPELVIDVKLNTVDVGRDLATLIPDKSLYNGTQSNGLIRQTPDMGDKLNRNSALVEETHKLDKDNNKDKQINDSIRQISKNDDKLLNSNTQELDKKNTHSDDITVKEELHTTNNTLQDNQYLLTNSNSVPIYSSNVNSDNNENETLSYTNKNTQNRNLNTTNVDLETAAITIQKVFRTFLFKNRGSTFEDIGNDEVNFIHDDDNNKAVCDFPNGLSIDRRAHGINRTDTVLQTVNEEKSLSLSTDDSSTLSSAATIIQAHIRGFLVRNKLNWNKTMSTTSLVATNSNDQSVGSLETDNDHNKNKTVLNIHIVPEGRDCLSRDESLITSMDLSLDSPTSTINLHPLSNDKFERRRRLKREDAIQSISPPTNNSVKLSEDFDFVKEITLNDHEVPVDDIYDSNSTKEDLDGNDILSENYFIQTCKANVVADNTTYNADDLETDLKENKKSVIELNADERDVVTPFTPRDDAGLIHSGEFHDAVLPTKVSRCDTSVVSGE